MSFTQYLFFLVCAEVFNIKFDSFFFKIMSKLHHSILTADKGVALVVMDKSQYIDKCMALLDDTKVYKPCKDTTKKLHRDVQEAL